MDIPPPTEDLESQGTVPMARPIAVEPEITASSTPSPRYCTRCGTPRNPELQACPACAAQLVAAPTPSTPARSGRALKSALGLYFAMLLTSLSLFFSSRTGSAGILTVEAVDALLVLIWVLAGWRMVMPSLLKVPPVRYFGLGVLLPVGTFLAATVAIALLKPLGLEEISSIEPFLQEGHGWRMVILASCIQPAVIEELAFRGVILTGLTRVLSSREAVLVSAMLFMVLHLSVLSFPHLLLIGLVVGWLRVRTGSLYPCILVHFLHNLYCVLSERAWG